MVNISRIRELIDQIPEIKEKFYLGEIGWFSTYNREAGKKFLSSMQNEMIYKNPEFMTWRDELVLGLSDLKKSDYIDEIITLLKKFSGFGDKGRFERVESKLKVLYSNLEDHVMDPLDIQIEDPRISEQELINSISRALSKMQRNHIYNRSCTEDTMNDYIRDILDESYSIKDQTRQGESVNGNAAGEIDIQLCSEKMPVVMIEGVKLKSLEAENINVHIEKVLTKYDPNGCPYVFLLIYYTGARLESFSSKLLEYISKYQFPYEKETEIVDVDTGYAEMKHMQIILLRNRQRVRMHFFVAHIE